MKVTIKEVEVSKLNLQPGDVLAVTIKSDDFDETQLKAFLDGFKSRFPNNEVGLCVVGQNEDVRYSILSKSDPTTTTCSDCDCGKGG